MTIHVHLLPSLFDPSDLAGGVAVMIDVLRASSTIAIALHNGANAVYPFAEIETTRAYANDHGCLTGGERGGVRIEGFDLGNSPASYTPATVASRDVCFTTTNGTQALAKMAQAAEVLIAAFVNRAAVAERLRNEQRSVHLVCAGTDGRMTAEDVLFAGALASDLTDGRDCPLPLQTQLAMEYYRANSKDNDALRAAVRAGQGGQNLIRLGMGADIDVVLKQNVIHTVPILVDGAIRPTSRDAGRI